MNEIKLIRKYINAINQTKPKILNIVDTSTYADIDHIIRCLNGNPYHSIQLDDAVQILNQCHGLNINISSIDDKFQKIILTCIELANEKQIPVILDINGYSLSEYRAKFINKILTIYNVSIIIVNENEKKFFKDYDMLLPEYTEKIKKVNSNSSNEVINEANNFISRLDKLQLFCKKYNSILLITGKIYQVLDGVEQLALENHIRIYKYIQNDSMLAAAISVYFAANPKEWKIPLIAQVASTFKGCADIVMNKKNSSIFGAYSFISIFKDILTEFQNIDTTKLSSDTLTDNKNNDIKQKTISKTKKSN